MVRRTVNLPDAVDARVREAAEEKPGRLSLWQTSAGGASGTGAAPSRPARSCRSRPPPAAPDPAVTRALTGEDWTDDSAEHAEAVSSPPTRSTAFSGWWPPTPSGTWNAGTTGGAGPRRPADA